jgi:hypothetical protein
MQGYLEVVPKGTPLALYQNGAGPMRAPAEGRRAVHAGTPPDGHAGAGK